MTKTSKHGFTLAEVLTTLMVIGVVAAMTIPTLINSTNDQQMKTAFKKALSVLSQGTQLLIAKEIECTISDDVSLAVCMNNVLSGTLGTSSDDNNTITTADGMVYAFYVPSSTSQPSLTDKCGDNTKMTNNTAGWRGDATCGVIIDVNGKSKGTRVVKSSTNYTWTQGSGFTPAESGVAKDQFAVTLTSAGVRPIYESRTDGGYNYMYGTTTSPYTATGAAVK